MRDLGKLVCHIPAREGSKRVPHKNLRYIAGKPLISYAISCAKEVGMFESIYVNTDSEELLNLAESFGVKSYRRDAWLASDDAKGDDFTADFISNVKPDTLLMINPVCPLIEAEDIKSAILAFKNSDCDTLISCEETKMQVFFEKIGVNIDADRPLEPTQKNKPVQILNWAVSIWDAKTFLTAYRDHKKGYLGKNRKFFPIDPLKSVKISCEKDFHMAEQLLLSKKINSGKDEFPQYWKPGI